MEGYYRLAECGLELPAAATVIPAASFSPVSAATLVLEAAEARARSIIADADAAFLAEKRRGYDDGLAEARLASVARLVDENRALDIGLHNLEIELSRIVLSCVCKLIDGFSDSDRAQAIVRSALKQVRRERRAELRVPPELFSHLRATMTSITTEFPEMQLVDTVEDAGLSGSHIVLETAIGRVDGNLERHLDELHEIICGGSVRGRAICMAVHEIDAGPS